MRDEERVKKANDSLKTYKKRVENFLERYLNGKICALKEAHLLGEEVGELIKHFVLGGSKGKRIRPAFTYYGYLAVGGEDEDKILYAAAATEILHNFFLIHDDIIDKSEWRRGLPTIHKSYERIYEDKGLISNLNGFDKAHFGSCMAIVAGDICSALAYEALVESGFKEKKVLQALKLMQEIVRFTAVGEMLDIVKAINKKATEEEVLQIYYLKTARYTVEGPLHLGAVLHGTTQEVLNSLSKYAIPVGIAFQIHDDILGIFGEERELGKPVISDIKEGKQTLLIVKAFENATPHQKEKLEMLTGNPNITESDLEEVREIIKDTGALEYSKIKEISLIEEGKRALNNIPIQEDIKDILLGTADLIIERKF